MKNVRSQTIIWAVLASSLFIWALILRITGTPLQVKATWEAVKQLPTVVSVEAVLCGIFMKWAWRLRFFQGWLVPFAVLTGTWEGTLQTTWTDPATDRVPGPIPVVLVIRQSFLHVSCTMHTQEMSSVSYAASFLVDPDSGSNKLVYTYTSRPGIGIRDRSRIHDGTALLGVVNAPARQLAGEYWTSRNTTGAINLTYRSGKLLQRFPDDLSQSASKGKRLSNPGKGVR